MSCSNVRDKRVQKSFTGCARCKEKKKKCDEATPSCLACNRAGELCPGFNHQLKWSRKHERFGQTAKHHATSRRKNTSSLSHRREADIQYGHSQALPPTSSTMHSSGAVDSQPVDFESLQHTSGLDMMLSEWINADFLPRGDLPLLDIGVMTPSLGESATGLVGTGSHLSSLTNIADEELSLVPREEPYGSPEGDDFNDEIGLGHHMSIAGAPEPSSGSSLLETYYRMLLPTPVAQFSAEHLVKHYFRSVCSLISCFDSTLNPFRTLVADELNRSTTVSLSIQSMSIAHLANHYQYMMPLGVSKRCQAWKSLQSDLRLHRTGKMPLETVLITLLLLGSSASWHQPSNLGLPYLFVARTLMQGYFRSGRSAHEQTRLKNERFFFDALLHWEMLASFLDPFPMMAFPGYGMPNPPLSSGKKLMVPHPWTGVSPELHFALAEVGRILRRRQKKPFKEDCPQDNLNMANDERWAAKLENYLNSVELPTLNDIIDFGDDDTSTSDLIRAAHAYRYIALLELYRAFPQSYNARRSANTGLPLLFDREIVETTDHSAYIKAIHSSLCGLSIEVLGVVKEISLSSSACRLLQLVFVSCACQLRSPDNHPATDESQNPHDNQVVEARYLVESRMLALSTRYPQWQMLQSLEIVKEVWDRLDSNQDNAHWMDVMQEKQLQTMMG